MKRRMLRFARFLAAGAFILPASCSREEVEPAGDGPVVLQAWVHSGRQSERRTIQEQVSRFNAREDDVEIRLTLIPEGAYNAQLQAAALAGDLPDVLEFDGPFLYNYAWQGHLLPVRDLLPESTFDDLIPSIVDQGTYRDRFWAAGVYDSGLGLYGSRDKLEALGVRIPPHPSEAWTVKEFNALLEKLAKRDPDGRVLDLKLNYRGEWFTYAFSSALRSAGGGLVSRPDFETARGILDGPGAVEAMGWFRRWVHERKRVDANVDDNAFPGGRVALSWVGHWEYERYRKAYGDDLLLLPLPDFGTGSRTGQGSWCWGVTRACPRPDVAGRFLDFLLEDRQILEMTRANGAVPATRSAIEKSDAYRQGRPRHLFATQLTEGFVVPRPRTPAYPVITTVFRNGFQDILEGSNVERVLQRAAREITQDIRDNRGCPPAAERKDS